MYKKIFIAVDNSRHSDFCIEIGIDLSRKFGSSLVGCHVYDASLHQRRFRDMEKGLPPQYQDENVLQRQRDLHSTLINQGLKLISESYLDVFKKKCSEQAVPHESLLLEGKNYYEIIKEVNRNRYDLVILGALGLAAINENVIGSVCERVVRRIKTDVLVVKNRCLVGKVVIAVDGSMSSIAGVKSAINFAKSLNTKLVAVSVFDPHYHRVAFESIANVLSKEAGQVFRFKEQETLHEEIIDKGLAKIYQNHLDRANRMAKDAGVELDTVLMDGKPYDKILSYIKKENPSTLIIGRTGIHNTNGLDIGSTTENLLRLSPCNILLTGGNLEAKPDNMVDFSAFRMPVNVKDSTANSQEYQLNKNGSLGMVKSDKKKCNTAGIKRLVPVWTQEAQTQTEKIPSFVRGVVRKKIEEYAQEKGYQEITVNIVDEAKRLFIGKDTFHNKYE
ncbi:MAG: universal stress protein [Planctomycetia bacterium]|nr:universal stress protein [Planctomycetia bacterium]